MVPAVSVVYICSEMNANNDIVLPESLHLDILESLNIYM
jgi:hypothetical protein